MLNIKKENAFKKIKLKRQQTLKEYSLFEPLLPISPMHIGNKINLGENGSLVSLSWSILLHVFSTYNLKKH